MKRPCLLNTYAVRILSYSKCCSCAATLFLQDCSLENLDPFTVTLFDLSVNFYGVSYSELRRVLFELFSLNVLDNIVHCVTSLLFGRS